LGLPKGVCPLFFPLLVESRQEREVIYEALKNMGITSHPWWKTFHPAVNWDEFPDAVYLKECLLGLPIHQDITRHHLDRIVNVLDTVLSRMEISPCPK
jgi:dTDP-4-amino-4,6-dideoxygalactose transaminase